MGSCDGAEICELVGLFLLNNLAERFGKERVGLYRDDGLLILKATGGRQADQARKDLHRMFNEFDLEVTAQINNHQVNFLDITSVKVSYSCMPNAKSRGAGRSIIGGTHIHIFVFCLISSYWNRNLDSRFQY